MDAGRRRTAASPLPVLLLLLGLLAMHGLGTHGLMDHGPAMPQGGVAQAERPAASRTDLGETAHMHMGAAASRAAHLLNAPVVGDPAQTAAALVGALPAGPAGHAMGVMGLCLAVLLGGLALALLAAAAARAAHLGAVPRPVPALLPVESRPRHRTLDLVADLCISRT